jgi:hypothetical protein
MRRIIMLGILLLAGCEGINGPRVHRQDTTKVDDPGLTIAEQEARGRDRLALPENNSMLPHAINDAGLATGTQGR